MKASDLLAQRLRVQSSTLYKAAAIHLVILPSVIAQSFSCDLRLKIVGGLIIGLGEFRLLDELVGKAWLGG